MEESFAAMNSYEIVTEIHRLIDEQLDAAKRRLNPDERKACDERKQLIYQLLERLAQREEAN